MNSSCASTLCQCTQIEKAIIRVRKCSTWEPRVQPFNTLSSCFVFLLLFVCCALNEVLHVTAIGEHVNDSKRQRFHYVCYMCVVCYCDKMTEPMSILADWVAWNIVGQSGRRCRASSSWNCNKLANEFIVYLLIPMESSNQTHLWANRDEIACNGKQITIIDDDSWTWLANLIVILLENSSDCPVSLCRRFKAPKDVL